MNELRTECVMADIYGCINADRRTSYRVVMQMNTGTSRIPLAARCTDYNSIMYSFAAVAVAVAHRHSAEPADTYLGCIADFQIGPNDECSRPLTTITMQSYTYALLLRLKLQRASQKTFSALGIGGKRNKIRKRMPRRVIRRDNIVN